MRIQDNARWEGDAETRAMGGLDKCEEDSQWGLRAHIFRQEKLLALSFVRSFIHSLLRQLFLKHLLDAQHY